MPQELPVIGAADPSVVRTALAVEARDGMLHVFFPPLYAVEDWLDLAAAVEETAAEIGRKVVPGRLPAAARSRACCTSPSPPIPA